MFNKPVKGQSYSAQSYHHNTPFMHQQHMRPSRNIRVDSNREDKLIILAVEVVEMVAPDILHVPRVDKAMTVRRVLDEHHRW